MENGKTDVNMPLTSYSIIFDVIRKYTHMYMNVFRRLARIPIDKQRPH